MIGWLYRMIIGRFSFCEHRWEILGKTMVGNEDSNVYHSYILVMQCRNCGDIKENRIHG